MKGQCLCEQVEFEVLGEAPKLYQCHCSLCRKQGGSSSNTATIVPDGNFRWVKGEGCISTWTKASGFRSDFCSNCGSPVPNPLRGTPYFWVPAGLLEDSDKMQICAHLFTDSKASWDAVPSSATQYATMPDIPGFFEILHAG